MAAKIYGVDDLIARCQEAHKSGSDFPSIWDRILRMSPLVLGIPIKVVLDSKPHLKIQLINGQKICFGQDGCRLE